MNMRHTCDHLATTLASYTTSPTAGTTGAPLQYTGTTQAPTTACGTTRAPKLCSGTTWAPTTSQKHEKHVMNVFWARFAKLQSIWVLSHTILDTLLTSGSCCTQMTGLRSVYAGLPSAAVTSCTTWDHHFLVEAVVITFHILEASSCSCDSSCYILDSRIPGNLDLLRCASWCRGA